MRGAARMRVVTAKKKTEKRRRKAVFRNREEDVTVVIEGARVKGSRE
jgi:hypothetical protein